MANTYQIPAFLGIDEGRSENTLEPGWSPEAWNMDTEGGDLAVGKGFAKHIGTAVPGTGTIRRMYLWHDAGVDKFVVIAGNKVYWWNSGANPAAWTEIYDYTSDIPVGKTLDGSDWDFLESRIGNDDHLIIANGVTQLVKWSGSGSAVLFGSGEYVFGNGDTPVTISALTEAFPKADSAAYEEKPDYENIATGATYSTSSNTGTYTLTMPAGYSYAADQKIVFTVPQQPASNITTLKVNDGTNTYTLNMSYSWETGATAVIQTTSTTAATVLLENRRKGAYTLTMPAGYTYNEGGKIAFLAPSLVDATVQRVTVNDGPNEYELDYIPEWTPGDVAVILTKSTTAAEILAEEWGYTDATLSDAIGSDWVDWTKGVGVQIEGVTYAVADIDNARTKITFKEQTDKVAVGDGVKVRGGVSDIPVGYVELYYNRLFSAGDPSHPSRLYWSQPPGDVKTIENWSMDDYSEAASGGHTEIGPTNNDPIVGLTALSNQLIIHKQSGNYRLIGSNPSNFQILQINQGVEKMANTSRISHGDVPYWITRAGMYYYNGQQAILHPRSRQVRNTLRNASLDHSKGIECRDKLYFTMREAAGTGPDDTVLYYDMTENVWMKRNGFHVADFCTRDGEIYLVNENRYVCRVGGTDYDGEPIAAYWRTPVTDLGVKNVIKEPRKMIVRGRSGGTGDAITVTEYSGTLPNSVDMILPSNDQDVKEIALHNQGRTFHYEFRNKAGSWWKILGGVEILFYGKSNE